MMLKFVDIHPEVQEALSIKKPIVALESTIISHGMPYPKNVETALKAKEIVKKNGAVPATIAIINGKFKIGLTTDEIEYLGKAGTKITKTSRRDIPYLISKKIDGATTVTSTMIAANMVGIRIFATGGIGGVHRGASTSFDISADLQELANTNVAVVCAGIKSVLDLRLTLEYLETHGVPVIGYKTKELPAFYTQKSGFQLDFKLDSTSEIASFLHNKWEMDLRGGVVIANPVPAKYQLDFKIINAIINDTILESEKKGINGKEITPYLLGKIKELTKGKSLETNIKLLYNNVEIASKIAVDYSNIE